MERNNCSKIIIRSFLGFLAIASIMSMVVPVRAFSATENRYLQKRPAFTMEGLLSGKYGSDYETYLSDQFPARDAWIGIKVRAERIQGKQDVNGVYFGKQDYLIEKFDTEDLDGELLDKNLSQLESFMEMAKDALGTERVRVMMVPTASQILTDKMPQFASPYDQSRVSEALISLLGSELVIPIETVLKHYNQEEIYYKTDHHWTALGAYYGYQAWAESMGLKPWGESEFDVRTVSRDFLGTVYSKVNVPHSPDSIQLYLPKKPVSYSIYYDGADVPGDMYTDKALEGKDKYSVYMDGNHGLTEIQNADETLDEKRRLLIIKDSFAHSFAPFAVNHYAETYMIDLRYFNQSPSALIQEKGITDLLVLYQIPGFAGEKTVSKLK